MKFPIGDKSEAKKDDDWNEHVGTHRGMLQNIPQAGNVQSLSALFDLPIEATLGFYPGSPLNPASTPAVPAVVATADATPTLLARFKPPADGTYFVRAMVAVKGTADGASWAFLINAVVKVIAGVVTVSNSTKTYTNGDAGINTVDCAVVASGANIAVRGTGIAATNLNWQVGAVALQN